jgi:hypothetical protein
MQKIWLKQPKAASALDFSYFQHVSKLVTHRSKVLISYEIRTFSALLYSIFACWFFLTQTLTPTGAGSGKHYTASERMLPIVLAASRLAAVVT